MRPIVLTGFMGSGKSTLGRRLARRMHLPFFDMDAVIEQREGCSVSQLFARRGEETFRQLETALLKEMLKQSDCVIATGGGTMLRKENRSAALQQGIVVFLKAGEETVYERVSRNNRRPLAQGKSKEELAELYRSRLPYYEECHICLEEGKKNPEQCAAWLEEQIRHRQKEWITA